MRRSARTDLCGGQSANDRPYRVLSQFLPGGRPSRCDRLFFGTRKSLRESVVRQRSRSPTHSFWVRYRLAFG